MENPPLSPSTDSFFGNIHKTVVGDNFQLRLGSRGHESHLGKVQHNYGTLQHQCAQLPFECHFTWKVRNGYSTGNALSLSAYLSIYSSSP